MKLPGPFFDVPIYFSYSDTGYDNFMVFKLFEVVYSDDQMQ